MTISSSAPRVTDDLLKPEAVAAALGVNEKTLANWRSLKVGPRYIRMGNKRGFVRYRSIDVEAYLQSCEHETHQPQSSHG